MGTQIAIPIEEYLHTSYPGTDREYRDGEVVERSMPDIFHGECQGNLVAFFVARKKRLKLIPCTETRMRLPGKRVLIPDVAVFHAPRPARVPDSPPLVAIEILSPDDRMGAVRAKLQEYRVWGVPHVWLIDRESKVLYRFEDKLTEVDKLAIDELGLDITPSDIFD